MSQDQKFNQRPDNRSGLRDAMPVERATGTLQQQHSKRNQQTQQTSVVPKFCFSFLDGVQCDYEQRLGKKCPYVHSTQSAIQEAEAKLRQARALRSAQQEASRPRQAQQPQRVCQELRDTSQRNNSGAHQQRQQSRQAGYQHAPGIEQRVTGIESTLYRQDAASAEQSRLTNDLIRSLQAEVVQLRAETRFLNERLCTIEQLARVSQQQNVGHTQTNVQQQQQQQQYQAQVLQQPLNQADIAIQQIHTTTQNPNPVVAQAQAMGQAITQQQDSQPYYQQLPPLNSMPLLAQDTEHVQLALDSQYQRTAVANSSAQYQNSFDRTLNQTSSDQAINGNCFFHKN